MDNKVIVTILIITTLPLLQAKRELRVGIFPWIPDLADDKLQTLIQWIEDAFEEENPEIDLKVSGTAFDVYDINDLKSHLTDDSSAPHVVEIDTILLGEIVDEGLIAEINPATYGLNTPEAYLPFTLEAVQYGGRYYAVPTYTCGNFLMGINVGDVSQTCPIQNGITAYSNLNNVLNQCKQDLLIPPRTMTLTGNFKGSWQLPNIYIDAYIDHHGPDAVYEAIESDIEAQANVIADMKSFIEYCQTQDNKCFNGEFKNLASMIPVIIDKRQTITGYSYSEYIGAYLQHAMNNGVNVDIYDITAPPLGPQNYFLMYTDALVINKALLTSTTLQEDIDAFMNFYSRLTTRLYIAFGMDLPNPHPPRYLMQARMDFYTDQQVTDDVIYSTLSATLQYALAAPNHGLYYNRHEMVQQITQALDISVESLVSFNQCEMVPHIHPRYRNISLEEFVDVLQAFNGTFTADKYWEVLPEAKSDPMCTSYAGYGNSISWGVKAGNLSLILMMILCFFSSIY